jgi:hypothetical protein
MLVATFKELIGCLDQSFYLLKQFAMSYFPVKKAQSNSIWLSYGLIVSRYKRTNLPVAPHTTDPTSSS